MTDLVTVWKNLQNGKFNYSKMNELIQNVTFTENHHHLCQFRIPYGENQDDTQQKLNDDAQTPPNI